MSLSNKSYAIGSPAQVFESSTAAGFWGDINEFYLRLDLTELADLKNVTFLWAGFRLDSPGSYKGEIVANQFAQDERRFPARAKLLDLSDSGSYFRIEVLDSSNVVIKEIILKGPLLNSADDPLNK